MDQKEATNQPSSRSNLFYISKCLNQDLYAENQPTCSIKFLTLQKHRTTTERTLLEGSFPNGKEAGIHIQNKKKKITVLLSLALLPVFAFLIYIYRKDSEKPEPIGMLAKAVLYGVISVFISLMFTSFLTETPEGEADQLDGWIDAFFGAAIPEEFAKLLMLWLLVRKSKYFDEPIDGIVYAVCVSLGFAGLENVLYLIDDPDYLSVGIMRGITSIPGHFCFAVSMGYFYSLAHFGNKHKLWYKLMAYFVPVLLHGIYDALLSITDDNYYPIALGIWIIFCWLMYRKALKRIGKIKEWEKQQASQANPIGGDSPIASSQQ